MRVDRVDSLARLHSGKAIPVQGTSPWTKPYYTDVSRKRDQLIAPSRLQEAARQRSGSALWRYALGCRARCWSRRARPTPCKCGGRDTCRRRTPANSPRLGVVAGRPAPAWFVVLSWADTVHRPTPLLLQHIHRHSLHSLLRVRSWSVSAVPSRPSVHGERGESTGSMTCAPTVS